mmetsp:Transcript_4661/g.11160  ORF Transcript_4661/g.11160 Transcript_4661/m.11160 type:complete len:100 (-) Transcript_4661:111-410(-)
MPNGCWGQWLTMGVLFSACVCVCFELSSLFRYDNNEADEFPTKMDETMGLEEGQAAESSEEKSGRKAGKGRKRQSAATAEAAAATAGYSTQAAASNKNE